MESWRLHLCVWRTVNMHKSSSIPLHYHYLNSSFVAVQKNKNRTSKQIWVFWANNIIIKISSAL